MKNKISDLRDHMFAALERLGEKDITPEQLKSEIEKAKAVSQVGQVIIESAKVEILYAEKVGYKGERISKFMEDKDDEAKEPRPVAVYSNKSPLGIANGG